MLIAEIRGKSAAEIQNNEDYLTSEVFAHLRYLSPSVFWRNLFARAKQSISETRCFLQSFWPEGAYTSLDIQFWPQAQAFGEPDLWLTFKGVGQPDLDVIIEVKLWSPKTEVGGEDQLIKYVRWQDVRCTNSGESATGSARRALIYLTPRESRREIEESIRACDEYSDRLYRLQWQDVLEVASTMASQAAEPDKMILQDVSEFLRRRGLEYFKGFTHAELAMPTFEGIMSADFVVPFRRGELPTCVQLKNCGWIHAE
jgi:hypothetical protein